MKTLSKVIKIAFIGASGSGKTTCGKLVGKMVKREFPKYEVIRLNVALPLHRAQAYIYRLFGLKNAGQDGGLLQFLAIRFEARLGPTFVNNLEKKLAKSSRQKRVVINTDCRNNAYDYLKRAGFIFIRVKTRSVVVAERLGVRGDLTPADPRHSVEQISRIKSSFVVENNGSLAVLEGRLLKVIQRIVRPQ